MTGLRGALDRALVASCASCGAQAERWRAHVAADGTALVRAGRDAEGRPILRVLSSDVCEVCGGPEIKIRVDARTRACRRVPWTRSSPA